MSTKTPVDKWKPIGRGKLALGDCRELLRTLDECSIDCVIADPPYNYEFVGREWNYEEIKRRLKKVALKDSKTLVKNIPYGSGLSGGERNARWYKKNQNNAIDYQAWVNSWAVETFRVCKPGAYVAVFNATRFLARVQVALEDAGFYPRDVLVFKKNSGIPRGLNAVGQLKKRGHPDPESWTGYHSALRNEWEGVVLVQRPLDTNYLTTAAQYGTGLMRVERDGRFLSNIFEKIQVIPKREPTKDGDHPTEKPIEWITHLLELLIPPAGDPVVLDPFLGSGTTAVAAELLGIRWLGIDLVPEYLSIAKDRISKVNS